MISGAVTVILTEDGINVVPVSVVDSLMLLSIDFVLLRRRERRWRRGERVLDSGELTISLLLLLLLLFCSEECFLSALSLLPLRERRRFPRGDPFEPLKERRRVLFLAGIIASFSGSK